METASPVSPWRRPARCVTRRVAAGRSTPSVHHLPFPIAITAAITLAGCAAPPAVPESRSVLSSVYTVDSIYKSMQGPSETVELTVLPGEEPELVWLTGFSAEVVDADGVTRLPPEFMCHSNLGFDTRRHAELFGWSKLPPRRLFTVSQGQARLEFPDGVGIPLRSDETLTLTTQVLNHNLPDTTFQARVKVTIEYVRDRRLRRRMQPVYLKVANALVRLDASAGGYGAPAHESMDHPGAAHGMAASGRVIRDAEGRRFAGHWVVPPGRQENTTDVTHWMNLRADATVHHIAVHVHPFAKSLALRDATTGDVVFNSAITGFRDRIGIRTADAFSDGNGLTLSSGHRYELTSVYDNTSGKDQEAMAVMYLYVADDEFNGVKPAER